MRTKLLVVSCMLLGVASAASAQTPAAQCSGLTKLQVPGFAVEITKADWIAAAAGAAAPAGAAPRGAQTPHCRIDGVIDRRVGAGNRPYGIGFALAMPENWNGRFFFQGGGGLNGSVGNPVGTQATGTATALSRGFAVVSTDTGHTGTAFDGAFMHDQQAALDFAFVAIGRVAVLAKQIIAQHYGRPAEKSYYVGCSTGGREAMGMAQRYPTYFDGIIVRICNG